MILAFAHPGLVVPDLERAREFYEQMFGFSVLGEEGWSDSPVADRGVGLKGSATRGYLLAGHNCHLELWQYSAPQSTGHDPATLLTHEHGIRHLAFYVDDVQVETERFIALGGSALGEPIGGDGAPWVAYLRDPFGNIIELCTVASPKEEPTMLPGVDCLGDYTGN